MAEQQENQLASSIEQPAATAQQTQTQTQTQTLIGDSIKLSTRNPMGALNGRDANGTITDDSAAAYAANPLARNYGSYDGAGVNATLERANNARGEMINQMASANLPSGPLTKIAQTVVGNDVSQPGQNPLTASLNSPSVGVNDILERENAARAGMIDSMVKANGGNGVAILGGGGPTDDEKANAEKTARWRQDELLAQAARGNQSAVAEAIRANAQTETEAGRNALAALGNSESNAVAMRGQDIAARSADARIAGNPLTNELNKEKIQGAQLANGQAKRLAFLQQQYANEKDPAKQAAIAAQIEGISGHGGPSQQAGTLTLPQQRSNAEIDAARQAVAGLTPDEIKRKTQQFSETGRENSAFDSALAKAVSLAAHRMYGTDDHFDQRQQAQQPAGTDGDAMTRFRADQAMQGHKLGKQTDNGIEVFDGTGRLVGHYR